MCDDLSVLPKTPPTLAGVLELVEKYNKNYSSLQIAVRAFSAEVFRQIDIGNATDNEELERNLESSFILSINRFLLPIGLSISPIKDNDGAVFHGKSIQNYLLAFRITDVLAFQDFIDTREEDAKRVLYFMKIQIEKYAYDCTFTILGKKIENIRSEDFFVDLVGSLESIDDIGDQDLNNMVSEYRKGTLQLFLLGKKYISDAKNSLTSVNLTRPEIGWLESDWQKAISILEFIKSHPKGSALASYYLAILTDYYMLILFFFEENYPNVMKLHRKETLPEGVIIGLTGVRILVFLKEIYNLTKDTLKEA